MESGKNLERNLKPRHVEMIALGGTIGVGLFMGQPARYKQPVRPYYCVTLYPGS